MENRLYNDFYPLYFNQEPLKPIMEFNMCYLPNKEKK